MSAGTELRRFDVPTEPIGPDVFAAFGRVLSAQPDGTPLTADEAALDLSAGKPRFYLMELSHGRTTFTGITRHRDATQCLASVGGQPWWLAVAAPSEGSGDRVPALDDIRGFDVPGDVAVLLHRGTWHAGPYFAGERSAFFNLELAETNVVDHETSNLAARLGVECHFDRHSSR